MCARSHRSKHRPHRFASGGQELIRAAIFPEEAASGLQYPGVGILIGMVPLVA